MKISKISIENYKIFKGKHDFDIKSNLIFFVGENNTGKTAAFEAVNFVKAGLPKEKKISDIKNKFSSSSDHVTCTVTFIENIKEVIKDFSESKYEPYVFEKDGMEALIVQRSTEERTVKQGGKDKNLNVKTVTLWNDSTKQFENPSGIDTVINTLFEAQFIWADTDPFDVSDFGTTKICGRLLAEAVGDFFEGDLWKDFERVHKKTFHESEDSLSKRTKKIEEELGQVLLEQYGKIDVTFNFSMPESSTFFKAGSITVHDGFVENKLQEKGTGMQRAVALAMIQVYAKHLAKHPTDLDKVKPIFFFIDEPEICLHPRAQKQLVDALFSVSSKQQIFISTHSPYLLRSFVAPKHDFFIFERDGDNVKVTNSVQMNLFKWSPSWGEINFKAYGLCTLEFHDELFGTLHERFISLASDEEEAKRRSYLKTFDLEFLASNDTTKQNKNWSELRGKTQQPIYKVTLTTFIRNKMHHPESNQTDTYIDADFDESIKYLLSLL